MSKEVIYGDDARASIKAGIDAVADAVKTTLGPKGRNVIIDESWDGPKVTKDGVTVAKSIELKDKLKNAGAKFVKKVASKTADDAGDGTTTATVLAQSIVSIGNRMIASGANPSEVKSGIYKAVEKAVKFFNGHSTQVESIETLKSIATVSANGDEEIGKMIAEVIESVGSDGVVTIDTSKSIDTYVEKVQGLRYDRGFISNYFITNGDKMEAELDNPYILITDQPISTVQSIRTILELVAANNSSLLIITDNLAGEALTMLVVNKMRGTLKVAATKCPNFGDRRKAELEDIAVVTGGQVISAEKGIQLDKIDLSYLGRADKVIVSSKNTTIVGGKGSKEDLEYRIESIKHQLSEQTTKYNQDILRNRIARLTGGVAVLYVGAMTEVELNEKKDRIDDAICASKAAYEEGYLPGGGIAYLNASIYLEETKPSQNLTCDESIGYDIVKNALATPISQIIDNSLGNGESKLPVAKIREYKLQGGNDSFEYGYNARTSEYGNMVSMGVIDPTKVCRTALENAASIAGMYLTTGCIIVDEPEEKDNDNKLN